VGYKAETSTKALVTCSKCSHVFGQLLVSSYPQIVEIFRVIGAKPHHHVKVADLGGELLGFTPKKIWWSKTCKIWLDFERLQTSTANIFGTREDIQNRTST